MSDNAERAAFPSVAALAEFEGLTKRELFAAMAMQGIAADGIPGRHHIATQTAIDAVLLADALLAELAK